jgi:hypothetical protein
MPLVLVTVTGKFPNAANQTLGFGTVTFTPSSDLTDVTDAEFIAAYPLTVPLSPAGTFSQQLISTSNSQIQPPGWMWVCTVTIGPRSGQFSFLLPSSPSTVDISALMPSGWQL